MAKEIAIIDCETDPFKEGRIPHPFLWGFYTPHTGALYFDRINELMDFLADKDYRVYAHNGGKFDFHYMLEYIEDWQKITMINNRLAQWRWNRIEFCDSYCILPVGLAEYNKTKIDYAIFEDDSRELPENKELIRNYLKDDLVFTYELVNAFIEENGHHLTIASCAIKKLQKIEGLKVNDSGRDFFEDISQFYYGGRVECFKKGIIHDNQIKCYDINSAYPYAMLHEHPVEGYITTHSARPDIVGGNFYKFSAFSLGCFPFRNDDKTLCFPNDKQKRTFCCSGWELLVARELGLLKGEVHVEQKIFLEKRNFKKYVDYYYTIKSNSKKGSPKYIFAKLFLNSAYGKFGANPINYKETRIIPAHDFEKAIAKGYDIHGEIHDRIIISKPIEPEKWRHYNVATAASITGFVRAYLLRAVNASTDPLYCDTDSVICVGDSKLVLGNDLGQWKHEGDFTVAGIGGKKIYAMRHESNYAKAEKLLSQAKTDLQIKEAKKLLSESEKTACKGVRLEFDDIMRVCKGDKIKKSTMNPIYSIKKGIYFQEKTIAMT